MGLGQCRKDIKALECWNTWKNGDTGLGGMLEYSGVGMDVVRRRCRGGVGVTGKTDCHSTLKKRLVGVRRVVELIK